MLSIVATGAYAQVNSAVFVSVPALDDLGLAMLVALVGAVGGWAARRRK
jgi:hypothetical protein